MDYEALFYRPWNGTHELCVEHNSVVAEEEEEVPLNIKRRELEDSYNVRINNDDCD